MDERDLSDRVTRLETRHEGLREVVLKGFQEERADRHTDHKRVEKKLDELKIQVHDLTVKMQQNETNIAIFLGIIGFITFLVGLLAAGSTIYAAWSVK